jgi:GTP diphosphokinase / guanosine-3',5'-bis(diphosphate) 3'-diphosphatase
VELQVDGWDRTRMLEDLSRIFAENGINILEARCTVVHKTRIARLRNVESVFNAHRVTSTG